jgi:hypothetical protein
MGEVVTGNPPIGSHRIDTVNAVTAACPAPTAVGDQQRT